MLNIPGRARIRIEALRGNPALCSMVLGALSSVSGILAVTANHYTARVLIVYDNYTIPLQQIEDKLNDIFSIRKNQKSEKAKVIKANFKFNKVLTTEEFMNSRNVLSGKYRSFNIKAIQNRTIGVRDENLWYDLAVEETEERLNTNAVYGITMEEAKRRLEKYGLNQFEKHGKKSVLSMLFNQFGGFIIKLLLAASGISLLSGQVADAMTILVIIGVEAAIGVWQEYKAEESLDLLKDLSTPNAVVIRKGVKTDIQVGQLVPGDILCLEAGNIVAADARLIESMDCRQWNHHLQGRLFPYIKKIRIFPAGMFPWATGAIWSIWVLR